MNHIPLIVTFIVIAVMNSYCYAGCKCDDWISKGGYCVDYVKSQIPTFPIPKKIAEIKTLKNKETSKVTEGDVAIFDLGNIWHVAYVEKVHRNHQFNPISIDVSEMNFGERLSYAEYKNEWHQASKSEWKRAICCGVTKKFGQKSKRNNIKLNTVKQIWSPTSAASHKISSGQDKTSIEKSREALKQILQFTESLY